MHLYIFKKRLFILYAFDMTLEVEEFFFPKMKKRMVIKLFQPIFIEVWCFL